MDLRINLCLSDIDKKKITKSESNGKLYVTIFANERQEVSERGETHYLTTGKCEDEKSDKFGKKMYCGGATATEHQAYGEVPATEEDTSWLDGNSNPF